MSKVIPIALAAQYAAAASTLCTCLWVRRSDGVVLAVTSADVDVPIESVTLTSGEVLDGTFLAVHALDVSAIVSSAGLAVDNLELSILPEDGDDQLAVDLETGLFDNARFVLFECNYLSPSDGINVLKRGSTGEVTINRGIYTIEFRGLKQALQQPVGAVTSKTCRYRLGVDNGTTSLCPVLLASYTETVLVSGVASRQVFTLASTQPADWSGEGLVRFVDGENAGRERRVKSFTGGVITTSLPFDFPIAVGDQVEHVAGCRKRFEEDCRDKFDAAIDFGGEPHLPGIDAITKPPETDA